MVKTIELSTVSFREVLDRVNVQFYEFSLDRCDERTFYITISLSYNGTKVICDLIYLIDKSDLYGAISLNEKYDFARSFFKNHFGYNLLYSDEQNLAKIISQSHDFNRCLRQYSSIYPKYVQPKFFK
ncbi:hypothetical protein [Lysinibacillus sp. 54212]|uniref:hypothetical protein n=1 Tax=Lysinibacillus sp. 54212 TaxID=3119829 RepID=UPI002FCAD5C7